MKESEIIYNQKRKIAIADNRQATFLIGQQAGIPTT